MPVFEYKGVDISSKAVTGVIDADNEKMARVKLRKLRIFPTKVTIEGSGGSLKKIKLFKTVKIEEIAAMTRQLSILLNAKIPLIDSLVAVGDQVENPIIRKAITDIKEKVAEGSRMGDCMEAYPKIFDAIYIHMVKAGEASGALDVVLDRIAGFKEAAADLKGKVKSAMTYPVIMVLIAVGMLGYLFTSVVPKIAAVIEKQNAALPLPTQIVLSITHIIEDYWFGVIIVAVILFFSFGAWQRSAKGRAKLDELALKLPVFGILNKKIAVSRFARTLSTLLSSGVQLLPGLKIVKNVMDNVVLAKIIDDVVNNVKEGESLAEPLKRSGQFPSLFLHMISVGEKTGQLEDMLVRVADNYDKEVDNYVNSMTSLLTPVMLVFMGGAVGFIVFAVLMPILQMTQTQ
ncbi:MAG: type II secretion system inner membrane protein GspF [Deltaproteobacteria bacterium]|nr:type II secretion system inner membrane protein GspF [Deltaproteobacteria bacterium]